MVQAADLAYFGIADVRTLFRRRELSPVELVHALLERAQQLQERLVPYVTMTPELALQQARGAELELLRGDNTSPLLGIPVAYKDIVMTKGIRTTAGSAVLEDWVPDVDAAVVEHWRAAGAVTMGKLSTHEFALGLQPPGHMLKPARNPWNPAHVTGGSSSGSGAALAAGLIYGAIGTDTGGSIRNPASFCGISGLKPTFGRVSRYGIVPLAWSLDHAGPMARTAEDVAILLNALAGHDPRDSGSANVAVDDYTARLNDGIKGLRIAVPANFFFEKISDEMRTALYEAIDLFRDLGATVEEITIPQGELAGCTQVLMLAEAHAYHAANLARIPEKYDEELRNRFRAGGLFLASEYVQAQRARQILKAAYREVLTSYDLMLTASHAADAPTYKEQTSPGYKRPPSYTGAFNLTGLPSMAIPCGFSMRGLPLSIMLSGRPFDEATVLRAAHAYQSATDWHTRHPALGNGLPAEPEEKEVATSAANPERASEAEAVQAQITAETVRQRAAIAGIGVDESRLEDVAATIERALAPLRALDLGALQHIEPAVSFSAT